MYRDRVIQLQTQLFTQLKRDATNNPEWYFRSKLIISLFKWVYLDAIIPNYLFSCFVVEEY